METTTMQNPTTTATALAGSILNRKIRKAAVLGSGVMGSQIAMHFANIGLEVILLDIVPFELTEEEKAKGLTLENKQVRNRIVNNAFQQALKLSPNPLYHKKFANRIKLGNFDDDMKLIADADWIIEVVVERLDIKQQVFEKVEKYRKPGTFITSNTSGIPMEMLIQGRSEDFQKYFCGTHFFNPPRYLKLLEIIPSSKTHPEVIQFFMNYGEKFLGKTTVLCKDTPAFIANRIGVFSIMALFHMVNELGLTPEEIDKLTGPVIGGAKSATFRTADVVGLDTLVNVAKGLQANLPHDEAKDKFVLPGFLEKMIENKWLGQKTKQGFYKKVTNPDGSSEILSLDFKTLEYVPQKKAKFATLEATKTIDKLADRFPVLLAGKDAAGNFYRKYFYTLFQYVSNRIPEISDELYRVDDAMSAGFGWAMGPFRVWDAIGVEKAVKGMEELGAKPAQWVYDMLEAGHTSFYKMEGSKKMFYDVASKSYKAIPGQDQFIILQNLKGEKKVWGNSGTTLIDIGDGVLNLEFHTKMNSIGSEIISGVNKAIDIAEQQGWKGLVIANEGENFSAGANLAMIMMLAIEQEWDELNYAVKAFQNMTMRLRYSSIPVVVAPHGLTLGGGCEMCLHADAVVASTETYIGLVEVGVGVIPGGGGTKEFAVRLSDELMEGDIRINRLRERFLTIGMAKVATSGWEAFDLGIFRPGFDKVVVSRSRQIAEAKRKVIDLYEAGYTQPIPRTDITVMGKEGMGIVYAGANSMLAGHYISEHDALISQKLGYVLCGGDLSERTQVSEQYLLDLEREAFLSLLGTRKTLERIQYMLKNGKPLRN
jgi:3-hydroxyacyl-CoA dehydrogenase